MVAEPVDRGLLKLRAQIDAKAPNRRKGFDGFKGDTDHASRVSDHNPESPPPPGNPDNQIDAGDYTHDPGNDADMGEVSERIRLSRDRRVRYVIFNRRIFRSYARNGVPAWTWTEYTGANPHDKHMHVSVNDVHHDQTQDWSIGMTPNDEKALIHRQRALVHMLPVNQYGDNLKPEPNKMTLAINAITEAVGKIAKSMEDLGPILAEMARAIAALEPAAAPSYEGTATMTLHAVPEDPERLAQGDLEHGGQ